MTGTEGPGAGPGAAGPVTLNPPRFRWKPRGQPGSPVPSPTSARPGGDGSRRATGLDGNALQDRSRRRYRRAARTAGTNAVARALSMLATFVGITLISRRYTTEELGVWTLLVSTVSLFSFADLGLGNGVLNVVAAAAGRGDTRAAQRAISVAFVVLVGLSLPIGFAFGALLPIVPWASVLSVPESVAADFRPCFAVFGACVLIALPFGIAPRAQLALQEGWIVHLWSAAGSLASMFGIVWAVLTHQSLPVLVLLGLIGVPAASVGNSVSLFWIQHPELRPSLRAIDAATARLVLGTGSHFLLIAVTYAIAFQIDVVVISHVLGVEAVTAYVVPTRLFGLLPMVLGFVLAPLWPAYAESMSAGDPLWASRTLRRSLAASTLSLPVAGLLALLTPWLMSRWLPDGTEVPGLLVLGVAWWSVVASVGTPLTFFLNGARVLRVQIAMAVVVTAANFLLSVVLVQRVGLAGPILATAGTQSVLVLVPSLLLVRPVLRARTAEDVERWAGRWVDRGARRANGVAAS